MPFYNGTEAEGRAKFKAFLDIGMCLLAANWFRPIFIFISGPIMDTTKEIPYEEVNGLQVYLIPLTKNTF